MHRNGCRGAAGQQYAIIVGLIGVVALVAIGQAGGSIRQLFANTANTLQTVATNGAISLPQDGAGGSGGGGANQPPIAGAVTLTAATLGAGATYAASAVLAAASDPEGAALTLTGVGAPSSGTVSLSGGSVVFTPAAAGAQNFQYTVSDGSQTATGTATVTVNTAASCKALKTADASLSGIVVKTIRPASADIQVLCDFSVFGGGWTLVAIQFEADPVPNWNEGRQPDYDPSLSTNRGFALVSAEIPTHTHTAFGNARGSAGSVVSGMIDSIPLVYTTGNLARTSYTSDSTPTRSYWVHRNSAQHYGGHDPDNTGNVNTTAVWNNTLTFNRNDGSATSHTWAFSPNHTTQANRGYSYGGTATLDSTEVYGWSVWVR